jgi:hypothetical protein
MASPTFNWIGTILLIIAFALILSAVIYIEYNKTVNSTFRVLLGIGIVLFLLALIIIVAAHWSVFFPPTTVTTTTILNTPRIPTVVY